MNKRGYLTDTDLLILKELSNKNFYVMELSEKLNIPHKTIKQRLEHLKLFKILSSKNQGRKQEIFILKNKEDFVDKVLKVFKFF